MAVVTSFYDNKIEDLLKRCGVHFAFGYGECYHFKGIPGQESSVDIPEKFSILGNIFRVSSKGVLFVDYMEFTPSAGYVTYVTREEGLCLRVYGPMGQSLTFTPNEALFLLENLLHQKDELEHLREQRKDS